MLSDSLDPDQDLLSGSKLFKWYDVCCNIRGGFHPGGLCPSCKIQRGGGGLCPSCKIQWGDYVLVVKFLGGILSTYTKMSRGGFVRGGLCPYPLCDNKPLLVKLPKQYKNKEGVKISTIVFTQTIVLAIYSELTP